MKAPEIAAGVLKGDKRCIAKAITAIENERPEAQELIARIFAHTGKAHIVGFTGAGGAGKSTLIEKIVREYRKKNKTVGIIAVDPTSPFTGGAFLGDRIRMQELSTDEGVYIRSMATRNYAGGISKATKDASKILDAAGKDIVIVETAGAGQSEVEIVKVAQTIVVLHAPGLGDEIQAIKAGIMEIADIFVVNKADRENANKTSMDIQAMLQLGNKKSNWNTPVLKTIALTGEGVPELVQKIEEHKCFVEEDSACRQDLLRARAEADLLEAVREKVAKAMIAKLEENGKLEDVLRDIIEKNVDPASAADSLVRKMIYNAKT